MSLLSKLVQFTEEAGQELVRSTVNLKETAQTQHKKMYELIKIWKTLLITAALGLGVC